MTNASALSEKKPPLHTFFSHFHGNLCFSFYLVRLDQLNGTFSWDIATSSLEFWYRIGNKKSNCLFASILLMVVKSWNWQHHGQTIDPSDKFTSINLFKILWVVTWAWLFLTSMEAIRGQTPYSNRTLWHRNSTFKV